MNDLQPQPPVAALQPYAVASAHGSRTDPYYWLRDDERTNPAVLAYLNAENAYREKCWRGIQPLENQLYDEILARIKQDDSTVPYRKNGYWYNVRYEPGKEHPIYARRALSLDAPEEILLDANALAAAHEYFKVGSIEVSPDSKWLAFCEDIVGRRRYVLRFKDLQSGEILPTAIADVEPDVVWANDNRTILYVQKNPETLLGVYVKKHRLGADPSRDELVFEQMDHSFYTSVLKSKSERFIFLAMESTVSSEWRYANADDPSLAFTTCLALQRDHEYQMEHLGGAFVIRTNWQAPNFRLMQVPIDQVSDRSCWRDVLAHRNDTFVEDFDVFSEFLAVSVRHGGLSKIAILPLTQTSIPATGLEPFYSGSEEASYATALSVNPELDTQLVRYTYTSLSTPTSVYDLNVRTGEKILLKREPVEGPFDPLDLHTEFLFVTARDGARVPVSLVYAKGLVRDGSAPLLQYAYGAYGLSTDPAFSQARLSLLKRGFVYAIAHVRGGQEMGRAWYDDGRLLKKANSFTDFIDVTRHLVTTRYTDRNKVFAMGGSAGGLLMGAIANMSPGDYRGIVALVPFVDVVTTMLDDSIPLTSNEYDEWGDPHQRCFYDYMLEYSPYDNVRAQPYPAMLVTTGIWDSQVQYYEPAKWVAKLRTHKTDSNDLFLYVDMEAGHGGKSGRFQRYREIAREYAFILQQLQKDP